MLYPFRFSRKSSLENNKVSGKNDLGTSAFWNAHGSSKKLVLCCSALTNLERVRSSVLLVPCIKKKESFP